MIVIKLGDGTQLDLSIKLLSRSVTVTHASQPGQVKQIPAQTISIPLADLKNLVSTVKDVMGALG